MQITITLGPGIPDHELVEYIGGLAVGLPQGAVITIAEPATSAAAARPNHPLVTAVMAADDQAKSRPKGRRRGKHFSTEQARKRKVVMELVGCPKCGAQPGEYCRNPGGKAHYNLHTGRWGAYLHRQAERAAEEAEANIPINVDLETAPRVLPPDVDEAPTPGPQHG